MFILPKCPEVCGACRNNEHVFHILNELADICAYETDNPDHPNSKQITITGSADDEEWLRVLLYQIAAEAKKQGAIK